MKNWYVNPEYPLDIQAAFSDISQVASLTGEIISQSSFSKVIKSTICNRCFYIKHYFARGKGLRKFLGRSRARAEWENLNLLRSLAIPVPMLVAYGECKNLFGDKHYHGVMVTEAIPHAYDLRMIAQDHPAYFQNKAWRKKIIQIIARYMAILHHHQFIHYDLLWRNILVTRDIDDPKVYFIDIPSGRVQHLLFNQRIKRDFYTLHKMAKQYLSRTDQLRFYLTYRNSIHLSDQDKFFIRKLFIYIKRKSNDIK